MPATVKRTINYLVLTFFGLCMILPFLWMLSTSLKEAGKVFTYPPEWIPLAKHIRVDGRLQEVHIVKSEAEIIKANDPSLQPFRVTSDVLKRELLNDWIWPWRPIKYHYVLLEKNNNGAVMLTPVIVKKRLATVRILDGTGQPETISQIDKSRIFSKISLRLQNYPEAYEAINIGLLYLNSIRIAVLITLGQVFTSSLAGYAFSRLRFPFRDHLFLGYLMTLMVPGVVTMIPVFLILRKLGLIDTHAAVILPGMFSAYGTFMLRQFFMSIPKDLEEAAKIDGCSLFGIYWRIVLPLSKPALATLATFTFMATWRAFMWPLIVLHTPEKMTLPIGLQDFLYQHSSSWHLLMAGTMMAIVPIIVVFLFNQRFFIKGIHLGAVKG